MSTNIFPDFRYSLDSGKLNDLAAFLLQLEKRPLTNSPTMKYRMKTGLSKKYYNGTC